VTWTGALLAFRAAHSALRPAAFWSGTDHDGNGLADIAFFDNTGAVASAAYMGNTSNHFLAWRIDGTEATPADAARSLYVAWNGWTGAITATLPAAGSATAWYVVGDSSSGTLAAAGQEALLSGTTLSVAPRTLAVLLER